MAQKGVVPRKVVRRTVWGPEAAFISVNKDALMKKFQDNGKTVQYLECMKAVDGGIIMMFVFGEGDLEALRGEKVPAEIELRTKHERGREIHYLRAEVLPSDAVRPQVKLYVGSGKDENVTLLKDFPRLEGAEELRTYVIGFIPTKRVA